MSAKREKKARRLARYFYEAERNIWYRSKPPKWRIIRYLKWKKAEPVYKDIENKIKRWRKK